MNIKSIINSKIHKLKGTNYQDWIIERIENQTSSNPDFRIDIEKPWQFEFLSKKNIKKDAKFLDYGCGGLWGGINIIKYLDRSCYTGIDLSPKILEIARKRIKKYNIQDKNPELITVKWGESLDELLGRKFDIIWATGVVSHCSPEAIQIILKNMINLSHKETIIFITSSIGQKEIHENNFHSWSYNLDFFYKLAGKIGLIANLEKEWKVNAPKSRMISFTLK